MTANFIAQLCQRKLDALDLTVPADHQLYDYNYACSLLERFIRDNFYTFVETELVRRWEPELCAIRAQFDSWFRAYGWMYGEPANARKEFERYNFHRQRKYRN